MKYLSLPTVLCACVLLSCAGDNQTFTSDGKPYTIADGVPLSCMPNLDGRIDASEMTPVFDQDASFLVSPAVADDAGAGRAVDVEGKLVGGKLLWDWSYDEPSDMVAKISAKSIVGTWFASKFPDAKFTVPSDFSGGLLGVYSHDENGLHLHGMASSEESPPAGKTLLLYDTPVNLLPYPLAVGKTWSQTVSAMNACFNGICGSNLVVIYESEVDGMGEMRLPSFTFSQVMRVRTRVSNKWKDAPESDWLARQHQTLFLFECFGEVARATSFPFKKDADDPQKNFTQAKETRKLRLF